MSPTRSAPPGGPRYSAPARWLHWLIAIAIVSALSIALTFADLPLSPRKIRLINYHKWVGLTVLLLLLVRIGWRLSHRPPALPDSISPWQKRAAHLGHGALYLLMICVPIAGWFLSSARGFPLEYLGVVPLPNLMPKDKAAADVLHNVHEVLAWSLIAIASGHALAALKHQFIDHDDVLRRML
jgi:cytochrome b561